MVSGFFTSPYDHERIFSGDARPVLIASNSSSCVTCLKRSSSAFMRYSRMIRVVAATSCSIPDSASEALEVDVDRQRADFLHQHVERFRHPGFDLVLALDDVLVDLGPAVDVVGLDREHLL